MQKATRRSKGLQKTDFEAGKKAMYQEGLVPEYMSSEEEDGEPGGGKKVKLLPWESI